MTSAKRTAYLFLIVLAVTATQACRSKKAVVAPPAPAEQPAKATPPAEEKRPEPVQETATPPPAPPKADYNFDHILFEFNSGVLKTNAYPTLDKAAAEMKKDPSVKFMLSGYASAEGTAEHNMTLSQERASAVKLYLTNSGVSGDNLIAKGFGESNPISTETDEAHRAINRRVEIKKQ